MPAREPSEAMKLLFIAAVLALGAITRLSVLIEDAGRAALRMRGGR